MFIIAGMLHELLLEVDFEENEGWDLVNSNYEAVQTVGSSIKAVTISEGAKNSGCDQERKKG